MQTGDSTRRALVAGAAGVLAARGLAAALPGGIALARPAAKPCATRTPGERRMALVVAGGALWTADPDARAITAHRASDVARRRSIAVGGVPVDLAITGSTAVVALGFYGPQTLAVVDLHTRRVVRRAAVGDDVRAVELARDGRTAYVTGGGDKGWLRAVDIVTGEAGPQVALGRHPRGLALTGDGHHAVVPLNADAAVAVVNLKTDRVVARVATRPFPYRIAASPSGDHFAVSHNGFGADHVSVLDVGAKKALRTLRTGLDPAGVAFVSERSILVAERGAGTASVYDARTGRRRRRIATTGRPALVATRRGRAYIADEETGLFAKVAL